MVENQVTVLGWKEWIALPGLGIPAIKTKIDTGARTSALHTFDIETYSSRDQLMVRFRMHPLRKRKDIEIICEAPVVDQRIVKNSGGHPEERYIIETEAAVGDKKWSIEISLTNRDNMIFRMLLGRSALGKGFIIDPGSKYMTGRSLSRTYDQ